ncbi:MAG: DUF5916 domain-containing protein [Thermoanaerobaculia bacterium]
MRTALFATALAAAVANAAPAPPPPPPIELHTAAGPIAVDGNLDDAGWQGAATIDKFYETSPGDNIPARVRTIAYLTYDARALYIGIKAFDPNPGSIRAPFVERDNVIGTDDNIAVFLDTRNDKRSAMELRVNPRGVQADGIFNDANGNEDFSPDFFYDTAAKIDADGWSAEYRIPFSSLRYSSAGAQTWNILIWRNYPRDYRYAFHSGPIPRDSSCLVCNAHPLVGINDLPAAGHLVAAPYVTAQQLAHPRGEIGTPFKIDPVRTDTGLDVKWTPSADHALDLTLNPDFSQVETDVPQITVNQRFAVFYPEKRPFFLEGFDLFDTPLQVLYTRTITSPRWGVRGTGKIGGTAYTALITQDRGGGLAVVPGPTGSYFAPEDFSSTAAIARLRHDIGKSFVAAVFSAHETEGGGHNRVFGPDFQWRPNDSDAITAELLGSDTENPNRPDLSPAWDGSSSRSHAFVANWNHLKSTHDWFVEAKDIGDGFRSDLGYVPQVGYREYDASFGLRFYPEKSPLRFIRPSIAVDYQTDQDGETIFRRISPGVLILGVKNLQAFADLRIREQVRTAAGLLEQTYGTYTVQFDPARRFPRVGVTGFIGDSIDFANDRPGKGGNVTLYATIRPLDQLTFDVSSGHEWLNSAGSSVYTARVERLKTIYSFSARSLVRLIGQYVDTKYPGGVHDGSFLGSVLYSYKLNWQTVLYAGYGDDRLLTEGNRLLRANRSLFLKISYALQR